jgi:Flp pilus assembly protein TadB
VSVLAIILIALVAVVVVLAVAGTMAAERRRRARLALLREQMEQANEQLALARAEDRGWERQTMEEAARAAAQDQLGAVTIAELHLIQVVDRPGTDDDEAVFHAVTEDGHEHTVALGRRDGEWIPAAARR